MHRNSVASATVLADRCPVNMLHWWRAILVLALTWRAHLVPPTPRQRATDPRVMHRDDVPFDGDVIEGDLVHPDGIID